MWKAAWASEAGLEREPICTKKGTAEISSSFFFDRCRLVLCRYMLRTELKQRGFLIFFHIEIEQLA